MRTSLSLIALALLLSIPSGCASPDGATAAEKQAYTLKVRDEGLADLYARDSAAKEQIAAAPGYYFASCFAVHPGFLTLANGYGLIHDNTSGKDTFVRMTRIALGPGLAVKGYYAVATFPSTEALEAYAHGKWYGGAFAEASFRFGDTGGTVAAEAAPAQSHVWMWSHTGVAIEAAAGGGKVYPEESLN